MIDRSAFDRLRHAMGDDPRDLIELIESFLEEGPRLLAEMEAAAPAGDLALLRRHAHSLKSNARDLGATALAGLCAWFEGDLRDGRDIGDLSGRVAALREEWDRVRAALSDEIVRLGAQP
jgi:HPt (histidine-containing phosphotransfer) domain-containing protein